MYIRTDSKLTTEIQITYIKARGYVAYVFYVLKDTYER